MKMLRRKPETLQNKEAETTSGCCLYPWGVFSQGYILLSEVLRQTDLTAWLLLSTQASVRYLE